MKNSLLALLLCFCTSALGQSWPAKPVHIIVPFPPGGITDILARLMAAKLGDVWGQSVIVENRVGASGNIGVAQVAKSAPDGYTFLVTSTSIAVNATLNANPGYDIDKDFAPVINLASSPNMIITNEAGPKTLAELIDKSRAGGLIYGSAGAGTTPHLTAEYLFKNLAGLKVTHVSYKGAAPAVTAALAGEVVAVSVAMTTAVPHIKSGKLRGLAVTSRARMPVLPEVPTVQEAGFAGFEDYTWVGMFAPAGAPRAVVSRVNIDANAFLAGAEVRERLTGLAFDPIGGSPGSFADYLKREVAKWAKVIKETGAKVE